MSGKPAGVPELSTALIRKNLSVKRIAAMTTIERQGKMSTTPQSHRLDVASAQCQAVIDRINRRLGMMSLGAAVGVLTSVVLLIAEALVVIVGALIYQAVRPSELIIGAVVTVLVSMPFIAYSQLLIRRLISSHRELRRLGDELTLSVEQARAANEAKSRFLANMSHELRSPLNAIIGFSEIIRDQRLGALGIARYAEYAKDICDSGLHLLGIIDDILDLTRIQAGKLLAGASTECGVADIVGAALRMVKPLADRQGVVVEYSPPRAPITLLAVERMLRQILVNIVFNAVKFTPSGGRVDLSAQRHSNGHVTLVVADSGIGLSPSEIALALTPFGQVHDTLNRKYSGTGLGLPLAKAMIEIHRGILTIESTPGLGTTVTLTFPPDGAIADSGDYAVAAAS
ncbi:MAG: sensor histidine kinase [Stellaceae bacterium]